MRVLVLAAAALAALFIASDAPGGQVPCVDELSESLSLVPPFAIVGIEYDDLDGTTGIALRDSTGTVLRFCVDRRPGTHTRGRTYLCAMHPDNDGALLVPFMSPVEGDLIRALSKWMYAHFDEGQFNSLLQSESVEGLPEIDAQGVRVANWLWAVMQRIGAKDPFVLLEGEVADSVYVSPDGRFRVPLMYTVGEGLVISEDYTSEGGTVAFQNDFGGVTRVEYTTGTRRSLEASGSFSNGEYLDHISRLIVQQVKIDAPGGVEVIASETIDVEGEVCGFIALFLRAGSTLIEERTQVRPDATRGFLFFEAGDRTYVLNQSPRVEGAIRAILGREVDGGKDRFVPDLREGLLDLRQQGNYR